CPPNPFLSWLATDSRELGIPSALPYT
ncbi:hypothetical protein O988_08090, partial [Pseudogymnoascus sp. VKM F-3808]